MDSKPAEKAAGKAADTAKKSKGFSHPALTAMGIPRLRIPSRNWLIFWAVTGSLAGMILYDRRERKRVREAWKDKVSFMAHEKMEPLQMPRKVKVYIAPPPGDYLDSSLQHFRNYIKPLLTASATDYELLSESRQGEIRAQVAEEIRNKRRAQLGLPTTRAHKDELDEKVESKLTYDNTGGVICVGRGAYKEYISGLHEGWLGPLEQPQPAPKVEETEVLPSSTEQATSEFSSGEAPPAGEAPVQTATVDDEAAEFPDRAKDMRDIHGYPDSEKKSEKSDEDDEDKKKPIPKPYIMLGRYEDIDYPAEFERAVMLNNVSDPIAAITHPHLSGFLNIPRRMYRFFTQRQLAEQICAEAANVVYAESRPFEKSDVDACIAEELEWPNKWKQKGIDRKSEWMQEFTVDERLESALRMYKSPEEKPWASE
ncbi:mitochondrial import inner membrane translocase subunit Tim54p [Trichomonascus vanleenenianus]|uniref:Tim22-complex subunit TIM54 n=1 Tax=Trichomonascus vanleenenianus TaxID=2268995 RepID=UPI003ECA41FB